MRALALAAAVAAACAPAAVSQAQEATSRSWSVTQVNPGVETYHTQIVSHAPGAAAVVYGARTVDADGTTRPQVFAAVRAPGASAFGSPQTLEIDRSHSPALDGSWAGGAVAAWHESLRNQVRVATMAPGATRFVDEATLTSVAVGYSREAPIVAVGEGGDAAVVYMAPAGEFGHQLVAIFRPAGGSFGEPEPVGEPQPMYGVYARDLEIGLDGTVAVGMNTEGQAQIAVRDPDTGWSQPQTLGSSGGATPQVAVDPTGTTVAAVQRFGGDVPTDQAGPVGLVFRTPEGSLSPWLNTGLAATDYGVVELAVSAFGEIALVVEASSNYETGGTHREGIWALFGNSLRRELGSPRPIAGFGGYDPQLAMNSRGDAIIAWDECCPMTLLSRRRLPFLGFGPARDVAEPLVVGEGGRHGRWLIDSHVDPFGNGYLAWTDSEPEPTQQFVAEDGPLVTIEPEAVTPLDEGLPPVLAPLLPPPPPPPPQPPDDVLPPRISKVAAPRWDRNRILMRLRCNERCGVVARARGKGLTRFKTARADLAAGRSRRLAIRWTGSPQKIARAARRGTRVAIRIRATDAAGNTSQIRSRVRLGARPER